MKDTFSPEDFDFREMAEHILVKETAALQANEKLNKLIESGELKYESCEQPGENISKNKEIKDRMPRMVRIETWEW